MKDDRKERSKAESKHGKIRTKLLLGFMAPVILMAILGMVSFYRASDAITKIYEKSSADTMNAVKNYLNLGIGTVEEKSFDLSHNANLTSYYSGNSEGISAMVKFFDALKTDTAVVKQSSAFISAIHILGATGNCYTTVGNSPKDFYKQFIDSEDGKKIAGTNKIIMMAGSHDTLDKAVSINKVKYNKDLYAAYVTKKMNDNNGFIIMDISKEEIMKTLTNVNFGEGSIISFISGDGKETTTGTGSTDLFTDLPYFKASMSEPNVNGYSYETYNGKDYLYSFDKIGETGAVLCALIPKSTITRQADNIKSIILIFVVLACILAVLIGSVISIGIGKAISQLTYSISKVAKGDLSTGFESRRKDEFRVLSGGLSNMIVNMRNLITGVSEVGSRVSESSKILSVTSENILADTKGISNAIEEIEQGVMQQATDTEHSLEQMSGLSDKINLLYGSTNEIGQISSMTKSTVSEGIIIVDDLNDKSRETTDITLVIIHEIEVLEQQIHSIDDFVGVINTITAQTNLLSLNASIEAARAGDAGKGFAVVANEIRALAEHSSNAAKNIQSIVSEIRLKTSGMVKSAKKAEGIVELQAAALKRTVQVFENINQHVGKLINNLNNITLGIHGIEEAKEDTLEAIRNISSVSQQTAASAEMVSGKASNQIASVEHLSKAVNELVEDANKLDEEIKNFKIQ